MADNVPGSPNHAGGHSLVVICIEANEGLVEPMCGPQELMAEVVRYVEVQCYQNPGILRLSKHDRAVMIKNMTQRLLAGESSGQGDSEAEGPAQDLAPHRVWGHLRAKYGTRKDQLLELMALLGSILTDKTVVFLRFESEVGSPSASVLVRASLPCSSVTMAVAEGSRARFAAGTGFNPKVISEWLQDSFYGRRVPPLWSRLLQECRQAEADGYSDVRALLLCTAAQSLDTTPDAISLAAHALHHNSNLVPFLSSVSFGSLASERLAAISELCAWTGGHSFTVGDRNDLRLAAEGLAGHFSANGQDPSSDLLERQRFYAQKQRMGTCFVALPRMVEISSDEAAAPLSTRALRPQSAGDLVKKGIGIPFDGSVPSESMLMVLSETTLAMQRRWGRSLRCWREHRDLRDVVFGEPGSLGLDLEEPSVRPGANANERQWRLKATHPPASALKMKEGSVLLVAGHARVGETTPRSEIARRFAARPLTLTFKNPDPKTRCGESPVRISPGLQFAYEAAEIAVAELREGLQPLKKDAPPLSTISERVAASADTKANEIRKTQADKLLEFAVNWHWCVGDAPANDPLAGKPEILYRILLFVADPAVLLRSSIASVAWKNIITGGLAEHFRYGVNTVSSPGSTSGGANGKSVKCPQYRLWKWAVRWGTGVVPSQRIGFWKWTCSWMKAGKFDGGAENGVTHWRSSLSESTDSLQDAILTGSMKACTPGLVVLSSSLAGACPGAVLAAEILGSTTEALHREVGKVGIRESMSQELINGWLAPPLDGQRLWFLSDDSLRWLILQARCLQVVLAAHLPRLFRHFMAEGFAPELFFCKWLLTLFHQTGPDSDLARIWDCFIFERSYKVFVRAAVAIFHLLEDKLRGDVDQIMSAMLEASNCDFQPGCLFEQAIAIKVTRSMLQCITEAEQSSYRR